MAGIDSYTKLMLHNDDAGLTDSSLSPKTMTLQGSMTRSSTQSKFGGYSAFFDNSDDYSTTPAHSDWDFGTGDFTVDWWDRGATQSLQTPIGMEDSAWMIIYHGATNMAFYKDTSTAKSWTTTSRTNDTWYHMAVVRNGNSLSYYQGGTSQGSHDITGWDIQTTNDLQIGRWSPWGVYSGYIDEMRISKGIARWTANFTPETSAYSADATTRKLLLLGVG